MASLGNTAALHSPKTRKKARATIAANHALRKALGDKYGLPSTAFFGAHLEATLAQHKIPLSEIPPQLVPKHMKKANGNGSDGGVSFPLDAIPARSTPGAGKKYTRRVIASPGPNPNEAIIMRVLDMLEKKKVKDSIAERLVALLERLV